MYFIAFVSSAQFEGFKISPVDAGVPEEKIACCKIDTNIPDWFKPIEISFQNDTILDQDSLFKTFFNELILNEKAIKNLDSMVWVDTLRIPEFHKRDSIIQHKVHKSVYNEFLPGRYASSYSFRYQEYDKEISYFNTKWIRINIIHSLNGVIEYYEIFRTDEKRISRPLTNIDFETREKICNDYLEFFDRKIKFNMLFSSTYYFGWICGMEAPEIRNYMNKLVLYNDLDSIYYWLRSPNIEIQMFAYDALLRVYKRGVELDSSVKSVVEVILSKKGHVDYCSAGVWMINNDVAEIVEHINNFNR